MTDEPRRYMVGKELELGPGTKQIIEVPGGSVGVFNIDGARYALRNHCPHHGAPLCQGRLSGMMLPAAPQEYQYGREGHIIACPWHGFEFEIATGQSVVQPSRLAARTYRVDVQDGSVYVYV